MPSIFKKLIRKEFGKKKYDDYCNLVLDGYRSVYEGASEDTDIEAALQNAGFKRKIYDDIYVTLEEFDIVTVAKMHERLVTAFTNVWKMGRTFYITLAVVLCAALFLIAENIQYYLLWPALGIFAMLLIHKTYNFVINKINYVDYEIVLVYKNALEKKILEKAGGFNVK